MATTSPATNPYIFGRDDKSSIRLNYQHMLITKLCNGQLLHPIVQDGITLCPSIRIADIATGTALWLTDLSDVLPAEYDLHGFDISSDQYPAQEWLPKNVHLHDHDIFKPFPQEFLGTFDVVNIRFFITLLDGNNVQPLLVNLKTLLKPGGFLQWLDFDPRSARAIAIRPGLHMPRTEGVVSLMQKVQPDVDSWILRDSALFQAAGLDGIAYERFKLRDHLRPLWNDCQIMGMEELVRGIIQDGDGVCDKSLSLLQQIRDLRAEFAEGTSIDAQWFLMVGRVAAVQQEPEKIV